MEGAAIKRKPDIIVMLAVLIGMGVLVTELAYSSMADNKQPTVKIESRY